MKTITVKDLSLQFDSHHDIDDIEEYVRSTIELINLALQRNPYDIAARILAWDISKDQIITNVTNLE